MYSSNWSDSTMRWPVSTERSGSALILPRRITIAATLVSLNRFGDALASFERAIAIKPRYVEAWISRVEALIACNRNNEAVKSAQAAIDIDPDNALCRFQSCFCELR